MWKAVVGHNVSVKVEAQGDDWDTDPDFVVSVWCGNCYIGGVKSSRPWALAAQLGWGSGLGTAAAPLAGRDQPSAISPWQILSAHLSEPFLTPLQV